MGGAGGEAPMPGGLGDVPPEKQIKGRVVHSCNLATRGTLNPGKPRANEGGEKPGGGGGEAPSRGAWGVSPQKNQLKGREGDSRNPATRGTLNPGEP